jgi:hypothetical protein
VAKTFKNYCNLNGSTPTASRPNQAMGEILAGPIQTILDMSSDVYNNIKNKSLQSLKFTWHIAERLEELGIPIASKINNFLKEERAYRERLMRHAETVIGPMVRMQGVSKEAAAKLDEIGAISTLVEINPFLSRSRYAADNKSLEKELQKLNLDKVEIDNVKMSKTEAWDLLNEELKKADAIFEKDWKARNGSAPVPSEILPSANLKNLFDSYQYFRRQFLKGIIQAIKDRAGQGNLKDSQVSPDLYQQIQKTRAEFTKSNNEAYLKLMRPGKYVVNTYKVEQDLETGEDILKVDISRFFESRAEAKRFAQQQEKLLGRDLVKAFKKSDIDQLLYTPGGRAPVNAFFDKIKPALAEIKPKIDPNVDPKGYREEVEMIDNLRNKVQQASLLLYPEASLKREFIAKRKGTEGFLRDMLKVYAAMSDRYANQISQVQYSGKIGTALSELNNAVSESTGKGFRSRDDQEEAVELASELTKRIMRVQQAPTALDVFANRANQLGFLWFLGLNPASAMVNLFQVPGVALPWLSARFEGQINNFAELTRAYKTLAKFGSGYMTEGTASERLDQLKTLNQAELNQLFKVSTAGKGAALTVDEVQMLVELDRLGALRSGMQIYDIGSIANNGGAYPGSAAHGLYVFQKWAGFAFQKAELVNREVTALAAYRLARKKAMIGKDKPMNHEEAIKFAEQAVEKSQGAYAADQAPRVFMNPALRTILMFKKFPAHMATIYIRMFQEMFGKLDPNLTPEQQKNIRRIARRQFTGMMTASAFMSGAVGMPFYYIIRDVMNTILGDEDDPYSFDADLRDFLIDNFGNRAGNAMFRGLLGDSGADIGSRISYESSFLLGGTEKLPFIGGVLGLRDVKQGKDAEETLKNSMVELVGAGGAIALAPFRAYEEFKKGEVFRGFEAATPAFLRNIIKAGRFSQEGVLTARGDPIIEDITTAEIMIQALGFTPQRLSSQYKINNQIKDIEQEILQRKMSLMDQYTKAVRQKDFDEAADVMEEIQEFNKRNSYKGVAITSDSIRRSIAKRESISRETQRGIFIAKGLRPKLAVYRDLEDTLGMDESIDEDLLS